MMARATGSAAMTAGYRGNGSSDNEDVDNSKGNSGKNGEPGDTTKAALLISVLFFFYLVGLMTESRGLFFCLIHIYHVMTQTRVRQYT